MSAEPDAPIAVDDFINQANLDKCRDCGGNLAVIGGIDVCLECEYGPELPL